MGRTHEGLAKILLTLVGFGIFQERTQLSSLLGMFFEREQSRRKEERVGGRSRKRKIV
jgi:hypothetical protein